MLLRLACRLIVLFYATGVFNELFAGEVMNSRESLTDRACSNDSLCCDRLCKPYLYLRMLRWLHLLLLLLRCICLKIVNSAKVRVEAGLA